MTARLASGLCLAAALASADDVRVSADVDARRVGVEDTVELSLTIEGPAQLAANVGVPPLQNLRVVGGPSVSTQISFVNGAMSQSRVYRYTLQPLGVGAAQVGAYAVQLEGGVRTTRAIDVEVVPGRLRARAPAAPSDPFSRFFGSDPFSGGRAAMPEPKLQVEVVASRRRLHVGEALVLTYVLYTQASVSDLQFASAPEFPGFWSEELEKPDAPPGGTPVELDGERYRRFPFLRRLLFPTRAGKLALPPVRLRMQIPGSVFEPPRSVERTTDPLSIEVLPLPEAAGSSGAVGRFETSAALDRTSVPLGEAATLRFTLRGTGNLRWIERAPALTVPGARVYPPQVKDEVRAVDAGLTGSRTWEWVVVPETAGTLTIPAIPFTWFDPAAAAMRSSSTAPLSLQVTPSTTGAVPSLPPAAARDRGGLALRSDLDAAPQWQRALDGRGVALALGALAALHLLVFAASGLVDRRARREGHAPRGTVRHAADLLRQAAQPGLSKEEAAALVEKALLDVFGDVDGGSPRDAAVQQLLQEVQFLRYAPQLGAYDERVRDLARRAEEVVRRWA